MKRPSVEEMKKVVIDSFSRAIAEVVRKDFEEDDNVVLIGFLEAENDVTDDGGKVKFIETGQIYVVYLAQNDYVVEFERLIDVYDNLTEEE